MEYRFRVGDQLRERAVLALLGAATLFISISAVRLTHRHYEIAREADRVREEIATLEEERASLERSLTALNNPAVVERNAREKLNLQKPGEKVVVLLPGAESDAGAPVDSPKSPHETSNPEKWWTYFFANSANE